MSRHDWVGMCSLALLFGALIGWTVRATSADHRYIRALAERHEAEAHYWLSQYMDNKSTITKERKSDGKSN